jgi:hypothetical protein
MTELKSSSQMELRPTRKSSTGCGTSYPESGSKEQTPFLSSTGAMFETQVSSARVWRGSFVKTSASGVKLKLSEGSSIVEVKNHCSKKESVVTGKSLFSAGITTARRQVVSAWPRYLRIKEDESCAKVRKSGKTERSHIKGKGTC